MTTKREVMLAMTGCSLGSTGRQLFERNKDLATADDTLIEEGAESVDVSKFNREEAAQEEEEERLHFSDSD